MIETPSKTKKAREDLRKKGQFWTPDWVARALVSYVMQKSDLIFDPCVGNGAFYAALKNLNESCKANIGFYGIDVDLSIVAKAKQNKIFDSENCFVEVKDFILAPPQRTFKSIVANPPYIRHHRISQELKRKLKLLAKKTLGFNLDGRAGLHIYFLIQGLKLLEKGGRLAFIMPSDTAEGVFAKDLWNWIARKYSLECVVTFEPDASPFPELDTNPIIVFIRNAQPHSTTYWGKCLKAETAELTQFVQNSFESANLTDIRVYKRDVKELLQTGLSRRPSSGIKHKYHLYDFAYVMRGIATGANDFFFLTTDRAKLLDIPAEFLAPAIGRTRDVEGNVVTTATIQNLEMKGRPTLLFSPDGRDISHFPEPVRNYLRYGELNGIHKKALISTRQPWYKMEKRIAPCYLFAYLGRRNIRFIKNTAGVIPLTSFLCVYPYSQDKGEREKLWQILNHPETIKNIELVGKSYGSGAIKVEPRALENLPIPSSVIEEIGLKILSIPHITPLAAPKLKGNALQRNLELK